MCEWWWENVRVQNLIIYKHFDTIGLNENKKTNLTLYFS
jgi:hypothetical protein